MQLLLDDGLALNYAALGGSVLEGVLLNVVHDVLVDGTVKDWLDFHNLILSNSLLDDRCPLPEY